MFTYKPMCFALSRRKDALDIIFLLSDWNWIILNLFLDNLLQQEHCSTLFLNHLYYIFVNMLNHLCQFKKTFNS